MGKKNGLVRRAGEEKRMDSNNIHLQGLGGLFLLREERIQRGGGFWF